MLGHQVVVNLISDTTTTKGLRIKAALDTGNYPTGAKVTNEQMETIRMKQAKFHGDWNYTIEPDHKNR